MNAFQASVDFAVRERLLFMHQVFKHEHKETSSKLFRYWTTQVLLEILRRDKIEIKEDSSVFTDLGLIVSDECALIAARVTKPLACFLVFALDTDHVPASEASFAFELATYKIAFRYRLFFFAAAPPFPYLLSKSYEFEFLSNQLVSIANVIKHILSSFDYQYMVNMAFLHSIADKKTQCAIHTFAERNTDVKSPNPTVMDRLEVKIQLLENIQFVSTQCHIIADEPIPQLKYVEISNWYQLENKVVPPENLPNLKPKWIQAVKQVISTLKLSPVEESKVLQTLQLVYAILRSAKYQNCTVFLLLPGTLAFLVCGFEMAE